MTYDLSCLGICGRHPSKETAAPAKIGFSASLANFQRAHRLVICIWLFKNCAVRLCNQIMQATSTSHSKSWKCQRSQYWTRYRMLKLDRGQMYIHSSA
jgi:hypothetical protein